MKYYVRMAVRLSLIKFALYVPTKFASLMYTKVYQDLQKYID